MKFNLCQDRSSLFYSRLQKLVPWPKKEPNTHYIIIIIEKEPGESTALRVIIQKITIKDYVNVSVIIARSMYEHYKGGTNNLLHIVITLKK